MFDQFFGKKKPSNEQEFERMLKSANGRKDYEYYAALVCKSIDELDKAECDWEKLAEIIYVLLREWFKVDEQDGMAAAYQQAMYTKDIFPQMYYKENTVLHKSAAVIGTVKTAHLMIASGKINPDVRKLIDKSLVATNLFGFDADKHK